MNAEEWVNYEDNVARQSRIDRLQWLLEQTPDSKIWLFHDGIISHELFEQTRYCFVYGQYLATIILGMSFIEHSLAALFFGAGRNDLERANLSVLTEEALLAGWVNQEEKDTIDEARTIRNDVTHFRRPGSNHPLMKQTYGIPEDLEEFLELNAQQIILIVFRLLKRTSVR